jgi:hypothetical protein
MDCEDDIFIQEKKPKKERKRAPRQMTDETRERMAAILAKGRETRLKNSQLKREALEDDKQRIKETLKSKLKELKKQLKDELVNESIVKKKSDKHAISPEAKKTKPAPLVENEAIPKQEKQPEKSKSTPVESTKPEQKFVNPEPPALKVPRHTDTTEIVPEPPKTQPVPVKPPASAPIPIPKPAAVVSTPKPNLTAEYMRKLRAAYNF